MKAARTVYQHPIAAITYTLTSVTVTGGGSFHFRDGILYLKPSKAQWILERTATL